MKARTRTVVPLSSGLSWAHFSASWRQADRSGPQADRSATCATARRQAGNAGRSPRRPSEANAGPARAILREWAGATAAPAPKSGGVNGHLRPPGFSFMKRHRAPGALAPAHPPPDRIGIFEKPRDLDLMATPDFDLGDIKRRMQGAVSSLSKDLGSLRTGRATPSLLDPIQVEASAPRCRWRRSPR